MTDKTRTALFTLSSLLLTALIPVGAVASCGAPATAIHSIQSDTAESPLSGRTISVEGIITRDARERGGFNGFYLQQPDDQADNNPATSEALFIYTNKHGGKPGHRVRVTGTVKEFHGLTELTGIRQLTVCGKAPLPEAIEVSLPWSQPPESLENMRVRFTGALTIIEHYNLARFGELTLAASDQVVATEYLRPGPEATARTRVNQQQRVTLDDGKGVRWPQPVPWFDSTPDNRKSLRAGDSVVGLEGVLDYRFGQWRVQPTTPPGFRHSNPRPATPTRPSDTSVRVIALNLQNYFNGDGQGAGFPTPRGAETAADLDTQRQRLRAAISRADPDILAVSELENDGYRPNSALAELAGALGASWQFIATPGQDGTDAIRTALLYRSDRLAPVGRAHRLTTGLFRNQGRPPLAQSFRPRHGGKTLRVVVPHLKSKSCRNAKGREADQHDGQGCYNHRRTRAAQAITAWIKTLPAPAEFTGTLITGDLNSYAMETPVQVFRQAGYRSLVHHFHPCTPARCEHHSYRYRGEKGSLDFALATTRLLPRVIEAQVWNINADEPRALGYGQTAALKGDLPWRASDHNPVITDIDLRPD